MENINIIVYDCVSIKLNCIVLKLCVCFVPVFQKALYKIEYVFHVNLLLIKEIPLRVEPETSTLLDPLSFVCSNGQKPFKPVITLNLRINVPIWGINARDH